MICPIYFKLLVVPHENWMCVIRLVFQSKLDILKNELHTYIEYGNIQYIFLSISNIVFGFFWVNFTSSKLDNFAPSIVHIFQIDVLTNPKLNWLSRSIVLIFRYMQLLKKYMYNIRYPKSYWNAKNYFQGQGFLLFFHFILMLPYRNIVVFTFINGKFYVHFLYYL